MQEPTLEFKIGHENFANYRRLAYKWWYALAEFVDNSTQSYLDNKAVLDDVYQQEGERLTVRIVRDTDFIRIGDNAMGMDLEDLRRAFIVGKPPPNSTGRCRYGLGMKTAACWIGNEWSIVTSKLGSNVRYRIDVNVDRVVGGDLRPEIAPEEEDLDAHYTRIEVREHNRPLKGSRTISKIRDYLASIYRIDIAKDQLALVMDDKPLKWDRFKDEGFLQRRDGTRYKNDELIFGIGDRRVITGWVGVLEKGSRSKAGFSILHRNRVIKGWPDSWRPEQIFGDGGRNDLINQRLVGELHLEDFEVTHTKDEINWHGDEEIRVEKALKAECKDFIEAARKARKGKPQEHGPTNVEIDAALAALTEELATSEFVEKLDLDDALPPDEYIHASREQVVRKASSSQEPRLEVDVGGMKVKLYLDSVGSPNDPYYVNEDVDDTNVLVVVNVHHPHWSMLEGDNSVTNFLRHCIYDAVAEHKAVKKDRLKPDTIKLLKDHYLRVAFEILQRDTDAARGASD